MLTVGVHALGQGQYGHGPESLTKGPRMSHFGKGRYGHHYPALSFLPHMCASDKVSSILL